MLYPPFRLLVFFFSARENDGGSDTTTVSIVREQSKRNTVLRNPKTDSALFSLEERDCLRVFHGCMGSQRCCDAIDSCVSFTFYTLLRQKFGNLGSFFLAFSSFFHGRSVINRSAWGVGIWQTIGFFDCSVRAPTRLCLSLFRERQSFSAMRKSSVGSAVWPFFLVPSTHTLLWRSERFCATFFCAKCVVKSGCFGPVIVECEHYSSLCGGWIVYKLAGILSCAAAMAG